MFFKCFLATESVSGAILELHGITNKESLLEAGNNWIILVIAVIGHKCESPKFGRGMVTGCFLSCMVLVHFMSKTAPWSTEIKKTLASCLLASKFFTVWGNILDNLKKEKKQKTNLQI